MQELEDALSAICGCARTEDLTGTMHALASRLGYDCFSYVDMSWNPVTEKPASFHLATVRTDFIENYQREKFHRDDPTIRRAAVTSAPFTWANCPEFQVRGGRRGPKPRARKVLEAAYDFGYRQAYVVPAHSVNAWGSPNYALITLYWQGAPKHLSMADTQSRWLRLVALLFHEQSIKVRGAASDESALRPLLTDRERDCLAWACRGKTGGETADILGIGERTVEFHLQNAMRKLGVHNKVHAIAVAIWRGLIVP
jgi:DNA-binding CsgD family transcriptional regulator